MGQTHPTDITNSGRINPSRPRGDVEDPVDPRSEDYQTKFGLDADSDYEEEDDIKESADSGDRFVDGILDSYVDIDVEADLDRSVSPRSHTGSSYVDVGAIPIPSSEMLDAMEAEVRGNANQIRSTKVEIGHGSMTDGGHLSPPRHRPGNGNGYGRWFWI